MKKAAAILFISIYLLSTTEAHQLLKLPVIFEHFAEHRVEDKNITFLHFLAMHYLNGSPRDADFERDMQLPFKTSCDIAAAFSLAFIPATVQVSIAQPLEIPQRIIQPIRNVFFTSAFLDSIWQPPKFC